jgi:hypothetical protein
MRQNLKRNIHDVIWEEMFQQLYITSKVIESAVKIPAFLLA